MLKKITLVLMSSILSFTVCISLKSVKADEQYTIDEKYEFPIKTETQEWKQLQSLEEKLECTQIPIKILDKMTTRALLETWLEYPLSVNVFAYENTQIGLKRVSEQFNGLKVLLQREDLDNVIESIPLTASENNTYEDLLVQVLDQRNILSDSISSRGTRTTYVYTPKGTKVAVTETDDEWASIVLGLIDSNIKKSYPNVSLVADASKKYNCHSYAWYQQSKNNKYWMENPNAYMTDGSYQRKYSLDAGYIIYYASGNHSAVVNATSSQGILVTSKWGTSGLYRHQYNDCPYSTTNLSYWTK